MKKLGSPDKKGDPQSLERDLKHRRGLLGRLLGRKVTSQAVESSSRAPSDALKGDDTDPFSYKSLKLIKDGLRETSNNHALGQDNVKKFSSHTRRHPLAEIPNEDGTKEGLSHLIFMGDTVLGVTHHLDADNRLIEARVLELPLGYRKAIAGVKAVTGVLDHDATSRPITLLALGPAAAVKLRDFGHIKASQNWESTTFGRQEAPGDGAHYITADPAVSRMHGELSLVNSGETIEVTDAESTHGTQILDIDVINNLPEEAQISAQNIIQALHEDPSIWSPSLATN